jgi:hypothetical protein
VGHVLDTTVVKLWLPIHWHPLGGISFSTPPKQRSGINDVLNHRFRTRDFKIRVSCPQSSTQYALLAYLSPPIDVALGKVHIRHTISP